MATRTLAQAKAEAAATKAAQDKAIAAEVAAANAKKAQAQTALAAAKAALKDIATATTQKQLDSLVKQVQAAGLTVPAGDLQKAQATIDAPAKAAAEAKAKAAAEAKAAEAKAKAAAEAKAAEAKAKAAAEAKAVADKAAYDASPAGKAAAAEAKAVADRAQADADAKAKAAADAKAAEKAAADKVAADKAAAAAKVIADREAADRAFAKEQADAAAKLPGLRNQLVTAINNNSVTQADIDAYQNIAKTAGSNSDQSLITRATTSIQNKANAKQVELDNSFRTQLVTAMNSNTLTQSQLEKIQADAKAAGATIDTGTLDSATKSAQRYEAAAPQRAAALEQAKKYITNAGTPSELQNQINTAKFDGVPVDQSWIDQANANMKAVELGKPFQAQLATVKTQADLDQVLADAKAAGGKINQGYIDNVQKGITQTKQAEESRVAGEKTAAAQADWVKQVFATSSPDEAKQIIDKAKAAGQWNINDAVTSGYIRGAQTRADQVVKQQETAKAAEKYAKDLPPVDSEKFKFLVANQFDQQGPDGAVYKAIPANRATGEPGGWYKSTDKGSSYSSLSGEGPVIPTKELTQVFKSNADFENQQAQQKRQDLINEQKAAQNLKAEALVKAGQDYAAKLPQPGTEKFNLFAANRWDMEGPDGTVYRIMPSSKAWNGDPQSGVKTNSDGAWYSSRDRGATFAQYGVKDAEPLSARDLENKIRDNYKEIVKVSTAQGQAARQYYSDEVSGKHMPGLWEQLKDPGFWKAVLPLMLKSYIGINGMPNLDGISDKITGMLDSGEVSDVTEYLSDEFGVDPGVIDEFDGLIESPDDWIPEDVLQPPPVDLPPVDFPEIEPPPGYDYELPPVDDIGYPVEPPPFDEIGFEQPLPVEPPPVDEIGFPVEPQPIPQPIETPPVDEIGFPVEPQPIPQPIETPPVDEIGFPVEPQPIEPPPFEGAPPPEFGGPPQGSIPVTGPNGEELYFDGRDYYDPAGNPVNVGEGPQFGEGRDYAGPGGPAVPPGQQPGQIWDDNQQTWRDPLPGENTAPGQGGYYDDQGRFVVDEPGQAETPGGGGGPGGPVQPGELPPPVEGQPLPAPPEGQPPFDTPPGPIEPPGGGLQLPGPPVGEIPTMEEIVITANKYNVSPEEIIAAGGVAAFLAKIGGGGLPTPGPTPGPGPVQPPGPEPVPIGQPVPEPLPIEPLPPGPEPLPPGPEPLPPGPEPLPPGPEPLPPGPEPLPPGPEPLPPGPVEPPPPVEGPPVEGPPGPVEPPPPVEGPPVDQPPPVEGPPVDQPPVDQPPVDQPPVDQPPVDQPPVDQPPVDQPPVDDLPPVEDRLPDWTNPNPTPDPSVWDALGLTEAQYLAKLAAGYVLINGILTPPAPAKRAPYGPIAPTQWGQTGGLINPGLNPGFMVQPPKFYETTSPVQGQYYWGQHAPQTGATFDPLAYNNVPNAPVAPWGLQQMYNPQTQTINALLSGVQQAATQAPYNQPAAPKV